MSSRIIEQEFDYEAPKTLEEALALLENPRARALAGGTDLFVKLKSGAKADFELLVDISGVKELCFFNVNEAGLEIGSACTLSELEKKSALAPYAALTDAIVSMASVAVRNRATLGGNLANASPAADAACALLLYRPKAKLVSRRGMREMPLADFFFAPGKTALQSGELLSSVSVEAPKGNSGACFKKKVRVNPDIAKVSAAVYVGREENHIKELRLAMGAVAPTPLSLDEAVKVFVGKEGMEETFLVIGEAAANAITPISDIRSTAEYRRGVTKVLVYEALKAAWERAEGGAK